MGNDTLSRRDLFTNILKKKNTVSVEEDAFTDQLFEKYSRKDFPVRSYEEVSGNSNKRTTGNTDNRIGNVTSGLAPYTGAWTIWEVLHLLRRTNYGFKKSDADALSVMTVSDAVNTILTINTTPPSPPVNYYEIMSPDENGLPYGADWTTNAFNSNTVGVVTNKQRTDGLKSWSLGLGLNQDISIREKMTWFWYHFIPVDFYAIHIAPSRYCGSNGARICYEYIKMFRDNAMGNFKTLIRTMATQPAMMYYLNNNVNTNTAPDENFAREIMELFTLGKDPLSQYTQEDVIQAAKVLTGWRVQNLNLYPTTTDFVSTYHDTSNKQFSSFFNNTIINNAGASELDAFIDMIFNKTQVVSEYICRRLYRYFVYYDIDANIEANVITPLAQTFVANNWDILPVLKQLFKSEHFFDMANRGAYIKSPLDLLIGSARIFNLDVQCNVTDPTNFDAQYKLWEKINNNYLEPMDQVMGKTVNVSGWQPFYQKPSFHEYWINSNTTQKRFAVISSLFNGFNSTSNGLTTHIEVDVIAYVQQFGNTICQDPDLLTAECIKYLLPIDLSITQKDSIKFQTLLSGQSNNAYWTNAWNTYLVDVTNTSNRNIVKSRVKGLLFTITQLAEYQLM